MNRGHECLDAGSPYAALSNFMMAIDEKADAKEHTRAFQMTGVVFRKIGNLAKAVEYGERALKEAEDSPVPDTTSGAARDLAATLHILGIVREEGRDATLLSALHLYTLSLIYDETGRQKPFSDYEPPDHAPAGSQHYVTFGMRASLLYDIAHFRIRLNSDGSRGSTSLRRKEVRTAQDEALTQLEFADHFLQKFDNRVWELNNLLRLIQVSPVGEKASLIHRAENLITLYPARNKELWAAIGGRRLYRFGLKFRMRF